MRVLHVTGTSAGGVGRHVREACALLAGAERPTGTVTVAGAAHRFLLAAPAGVLEPLTAEPAPGVRTEEIDLADHPRPTHDARTVAHLRHLAKGADVVHAHGLRAGALAVLAARSLTRPGRPRPAVVVTLHNKPVGGASVRSVGEALLRVVATGADVVLGVSGDLVDAARAAGARDAERALVPAPARPPAAPGGAPEVSALLALGLGQGQKLILTVARLAPQKGLDSLATAARDLAAREDLPAWRWVVVGDGPLEDELREATADLPVHVAGRRDDVPDLMRTADLVVNTSTWEGQPLVVQEALAAGAPVVATDVGGTREVAGPAAVLVPGGDARALADAVAALLTDDERREGLRAAARARALDLPTGADLRGQLRDVYARAMSAAGRGA